MMRVVLLLCFFSSPILVAAQTAQAPTEAKLRESAKPAKENRSVVLPREKTSPVRITRFDSPPKIDGRLDDAVWQQAAVLKDFYQIQPGDNIAPSKPSEVLLGYDAKHLYIAYRAV